MQEEHQRSLQRLQHQVEQVELDNDRLQVKLQNMTMLEGPVQEMGETVAETVRDPRQEERQAAEVGMMLTS